MQNGQQQENIVKLISDLLEIKSSSNVTPEQKEKLVADVKVLLQNAQPPDPELVLKLAQDLREMIENREFDKELLRADLKAVVDSTNVSQEDADQVIEDLVGILDAADISAREKAMIKKDIEVIIATAHANH